MATATDMLRSGLNLMRRLPPRDVRTNLSGLTVLRPELTEEFLQRVDQPLQTRVDSVTKRRYVLCDYNRDGDSYRSPWSNKYEPAIPPEDGEGFLPSAGLRELEMSANEIFDAYREQYFEAANSISSVYMWDLDKGFASCWLIKKEIGAGRFLKSGCWDSVHVIEVSPDPAAGKTTYKLTTTVMLTLQVDRPETVGLMDLSGSLTRQATQVLAVTPDRTHIVNMGSMVEAMEGDLRGAMNDLYIGKSREIASTLCVRDGGAHATGAAFVADLKSAVGGSRLLHHRSGSTGSSS